MPAPPDTVSAPLLDKPPSGWEYGLLVPYRVVTFPVAVASKGVGSFIGFLDGNSVIQRGAKLLGPRRGPFGFLIDFRAGGLSGFGGGLVGEHTSFFGHENRARIRFSTTTKHDTRAGLAARFGDERFRYFELGVGYRQRPNVRFFGFGPDAAQENESFFRQETIWGGATWRRPFTSAVYTDLTAEYTSTAAGMPRPGHTPATEVVFDKTTLPEYGRHSYGPTVGVSLNHETARLNRPDMGGLQSLKASYFAGTDSSDVAFWTFRAEAQQYFTLWRPLRVLALRAFISWIENTGDDEVPFARLNTNDDPDLLRGYDDFRWRDRGLTIATAEYRWPIWVNNRPRGAGVDAYLLTDVGQVFGDADEISARNMTVSYGGGLRLESGKGFKFRLEYARSDEGSEIRMRADQVFQFSKNGFLYGREPIPER